MQQRKQGGGTGAARCSTRLQRRELPRAPPPEEQFGAGWGQPGSPHTRGLTWGPPRHSGPLMLGAGVGRGHRSGVLRAGPGAQCLGLANLLFFTSSSVTLVATLIMM